LLRCDLPGASDRQAVLTIPVSGKDATETLRMMNWYWAVPALMMKKRCGEWNALPPGGSLSISLAGAEQDHRGAFPAPTMSVNQLEGHSEKTIVCWCGDRWHCQRESAVSKMLEDLGAPIIDYDVIARKIVEPETRPGKDMWPISERWKKTDRSPRRSFSRGVRDAEKERS